MLSDIAATRKIIGRRSTREVAAVLCASPHKSPRPNLCRAISSRRPSPASWSSRRLTLHMHHRANKDERKSSTHAQTSYIGFQESHSALVSVRPTHGEDLPSDSPVRDDVVAATEASNSPRWLGELCRSLALRTKNRRRIKMDPGSTQGARIAVVSSGRDDSEGCWAGVSVGVASAGRGRLLIGGECWSCASAALVVASLLG
jgi:hypothetical protein